MVLIVPWAPLLHGTWHAEPHQVTWPQGGDQLANGSSASLAPEAGQAPVQAAQLMDPRAPTGQPAILSQPAATPTASVQSPGAPRWAADAHQAPSGAPPWVCLNFLCLHVIAAEQLCPMVVPTIAAGATSKDMSGVGASAHLGLLHVLQGSPAGPAAGEPPRDSRPAAYPPSGEAAVRQRHATQQQMHRLSMHQHAPTVRPGGLSPAVS